MKSFSILIFLMQVACFAQGDVKFVKSGVAYTKDNVTVISYDFDAFEPQLHKDDDTIYVINFWATWCAPCVKELPSFEKLNAEYKGKKIKVILVSLDMKKQIGSNLLPFIKRKNIRSEVIHLHDPDANAWIGKVNETWSGALPATLIYSKGKRMFYEQSFTYETLEKEVKLFIN